MKEKNNIDIIDAGDDKPIVTRKDIVDISIGKHEGKIGGITRMTSEDGQFVYLDFNVMVIDVEVPKGSDIPVLRMGFPLNLSSKSGLGVLMQKAGFDISKKNSYSINDFRKVFLNRKIVFLVDEQKTDKGTFTNILRDTVKFV